MARKSTASLVFPVGGIDRSQAYQNQPPYTTADALNMRPRDAIEGRLRGGSRPGLTRYSPVPLGTTRTTGTVAGAAPATLGGTTVTTLVDTFDPAMAGRDSIHWTGSGTYAITEYTSATEVIVAGDASGETGAFAIERALKTWYYYYPESDRHTFVTTIGSFTGYAVGDTITMDASGTAYAITVIVSSSLVAIASAPDDEDKAHQAATLSTTGTSATTTYAGATQTNSTVIADAVFVAGMVGGFITFDTTGGRYEIIEVTSNTTIIVHGDATTEGATDTFVVDHDPQPVRMLSVAPYSRTIATSTWHYWEDDFSHSPHLPPYDHLAEPWTPAGWSEYLPVLLLSTCVTANDTTNEAVAIAPDLGIDATKEYIIRLKVRPINDGFSGIWLIYAGMADADLAETGLTGGDFEGVTLSIVMYGANYTGYVREYKNGAVVNSWAFMSGVVSVAPLFLQLSITGQDLKWRIGASWTGTGTTTNALPGTRWGFGVQQRGSAYAYNALVDVAQATYHKSYVTFDGPARHVAVASAGGKLYRTSLGNPTAFEYVSVAPTINSDDYIQAAPHLGKLYIADVGTDVSGEDGITSGASNKTFTNTAAVDFAAAGVAADSHVVRITSPDTVDGIHTISDVTTTTITLDDDPGAAVAGTIKFYVERAAKVYDPSAGTLAIWAASGTTDVPYGCPLICTYRDRIVTAGAPEAPHAWHMCQQGDPLDWDYTDGSAGTPISSTNSDAGQLGSPITALIPHSDDYLIMAALNSLWIMRGDPTFGGTIDNLSNSTGIIGKSAWCRGPAAELIFLSRDGLYILVPGASAYPESLSRDRLPDELRELSAASHDVQLLYDSKLRGVHIWIVGKQESSTRHWWYDWDTRSFWPATYATGHEPTSSYSYVADLASASAVLLGCRDGYVRYIDRDSLGDDGSAINSYVVCGPMKLGVDEERVGILKSLSASLDNDSADVDWTVQVGDTAEEALAATAFANGTWSAGHNKKQLIRARGALYYLRLTARNNEPWAIEWIHTERETRGRVH